MSELLPSSEGEHCALHRFGGSGPALLLSHGNGLNSGMWHAALRHLLPHFDCYGVDLRGHGACRVQDPNYSVARDRFADDVFRAVEEIDAGPVYFAGHSLGGAAALFAALRNPAAFTKLWLFEPVAIPDTWPPRGAPSVLVDSARNRRMEFDSVEAAVENFSRKPPFANCHPDAVRGYVTVGTASLPDGRVRLTCEGKDEARVFATGEPLDFTRLAAIPTPTRIVAGAQTEGPHAIPAAVARPIADALPNGLLEVVDDLDHFGPMQAPETIADSIRSHWAA